MNNYIGPINAEWVDPAVELPEQGHGIIVRNSDCGVSLAEWHNSPWPTGRWVAWLRIGGPSDAIPRAKVQAAVDGIESRRCAILDCCYDSYRQGVDSGLAQGLRELCDHTGITPMEVTQ